MWMAWIVDRLPKPPGVVRGLDICCAAMIFSAVTMWACDVPEWTASRALSLSLGLWTVSALIARR